MQSLVRLKPGRYPDGPGREGLWGDAALKEWLAGGGGTGGDESGGGPGEHRCVGGSGALYPNSLGAG